MNKLPKQTGALCTLVLLFAITNLYAQLTPQVYIQDADPGNKAIVIEAENASSVTDKTTGDTRNWVETIDGNASGGKVLQASGGIDNGIAGESAVFLQEAKAYFNMVFQQADDYYFYIRYKAADATANEMYVADDFNTPIRSVFNAFNTTGNYAWGLVSGSYTVTANDLNQVMNLILFPREAGFCLDKIVLSDVNNLSTSQLNALVTETSLDYPDLPDNLLKYTAFEGIANELTINTTTSMDASVVDYPGHDNYHFPFLGSKMTVLNEGGGLNDPVLEFQAVDISCDYTDLNFCFRWMAPQALENGFENFGDAFDVQVIYKEGDMNLNLGTSIGMVSGNTMNSEGDAYNLTCFSLTPDAMLNIDSVIIRIILNTDAVDEDVFIGTAYLTVTNGTIPTASLDPIDVSNDPLASFDGSTSADAAFYEWNFGDGTSEGPAVNSTTSHTYTSNGTFTACLSVLDACENLPDVTCQQITISAVLPVELLYFSADAKDQDVLLSWATATELNNDYFSIEYSRNGQDFTELAQEKGFGTTYEQQNYHFQHQNPGSGTHYYRLRQVDFDGQYEYSKVEAIELKGSAIPVLFPNPVSNTLIIYAPDYPYLSLDIYQANGRIVKTIMVENGKTNDINDLTQGTYFVRIKSIDGRLISNQRFVKL
ncbi:MAG: hypothetical protein DHS20C18_48280 [Saprospiraceae bacterium]|nr:MAG: hypothetical protein DHS20C18_48280 [Saprospiraceae bacterium]